jgi:hypothetical protein
VAVLKPWPELAIPRARTNIKLVCRMASRLRGGGWDIRSEKNRLDDATTISLGARPLGLRPHARAAAPTFYAAPISPFRPRKGACAFPYRLWPRCDAPVALGAAATRDRFDPGCDGFSCEPRLCPPSAARVLTTQANAARARPWRRGLRRKQYPTSLAAMCSRSRPQPPRMLDFPKTGLERWTAHRLVGERDFGRDRILAIEIVRSV